jgi:hypothetical protein
MGTLVLTYTRSRARRTIERHRLSDREAQDGQRVARSDPARIVHVAHGQRTLSAAHRRLQDDQRVARGDHHFYHRVGFRPDDAGAMRLAEREEERIARNPAYRTKVATLRRLAEAEMFLSVAAGDRPPSERLRARELAAVVTDHIARCFGGDREAAARWAAGQIGRALRVPGITGWPAGERRSLRQLAVLAALVPDLGRWRASDKCRLLRILRAKGSRSELPYVRMLDDHPRLRESLADVVARAAATRVLPEESGRGSISN